MTINQVYNVVNNLADNMSKGQYNIVDHSSFVNFGNAVLSSDTNREKFYNTLVDRIGKTIFAISEYQAKTRGVMVDSFTFGSILQKVSYRYQKAEESSKWKKQGQNPYEVEPKDGIIQKLFAQAMPVYAYTDVVLNNQLESAFVNAQAMAAFFNGLYTRMRNAYEISKEELEMTAINAFMSESLKSDKVLNGERRRRNLLLEYNIKYNKSLTNDECFADVDFLRYAVVEIQTVIEFLSKPSILYNDGTVERFYSPEQLEVEFVSKFTKEFENSLATKALNSQWKNIVELPNYRTTPYWVSESHPYFLGSVDAGTDEEMIIGCIRAKDAVICTLERERFVSHYDNWNDRTQIKQEGERRFIVDTSEAGVIFYVDADEVRYDVTFADADSVHAIRINGGATYKFDSCLYVPNMETLHLTADNAEVVYTDLAVTVGTADAVEGYDSGDALPNIGARLKDDATINLTLTV